MAEEKEIKVSLPGEWALKKLLGPTLDVMGTDLATLYQAGVEKITKKASAKSQNLEAEGRTNLRVTRDVFFNGAFSDEEISAEYFGGILAASRTKDGTDDTGVFFLDIIKSLSSKQLLLHFLIYEAANRVLAAGAEHRGKNLGMGDVVSQIKLFGLLGELADIGVLIDTDFYALNQKGLLSEFGYGSQVSSEVTFPLWTATITTLGIQLYAEVGNAIDQWRTFNDGLVGTFDFDKRLAYVALTVSGLSAMISKSLSP